MFRAALGLFVVSGVWKSEFGVAHVACLIERIVECK